MDLDQLLRHAGSVAATSTLRRAGFTDRDIRVAVSEGRILRLRHGVLALPGAAPDLVAAVLANGLLTCASAAPHRRLWLLHPHQQLHLLCRHAGPPHAVVHRGSLVPSTLLLPVASTTDVLVHGLRCLPTVESAVLVESALRQGVTTLGYLRERLPGSRNGQARRALDLVDGSADSAIEVVARILFRANGIFTQTQVDLAGIGIVDFLLEGFLIVELDGATHLERKQVIKDRGRNNASTLCGYPVLRYGYADVVYHPEKVLSEVWQVLRGRTVH
ncbi:DUF559 domain-containing protein [Pseudarthrobacter sp. PS3-L1]|uniref:DUF559 domain-containing protein n=1 Tax=Pseudarthrobacter sp. PS3-L1 TaxID=3046207 RepID=UPI0024BA5266|nr:DUF559 domain-containing protein [Pseudarthrobacter sp. PS3-L1]MDJ0321175.1 DUF559 domain-containing protein [Pseudarthrobacter sp. PS3-L1]